MLTRHIWALRYCEHSFYDARLYALAPNGRPRLPDNAPLVLDLSHAVKPYVDWPSVPAIPSIVTGHADK